MKIGLDLSSEAPPITGGGHYALGLVAALARHVARRELELRVIAPPGLAVPAYPGVELVAAAEGSQSKRRLEQQLFVPSLVGDADLIHAVNDVGYG